MENNFEEIVAQFKSLPTGWITDAFSRLNLAGWSQAVYPVSPTARSFAGRAVTVQYLPKRGYQPSPLNNYDVVENETKPGDVLVIAAGGTPCWLMGENQSHFALYHDLAGVVVDGCIRDWDEIATLAIPIFARGAGTRPFSTHLELVGVNVPVEFAGMQVRPGDIIVGDADGLVTIPAAIAGEVLRQTLEIGLIEKEMEEAIRDRIPLAEFQAISNKKKVKKA